MPKVIKLKNDTYIYGTIIEKGTNANGNYIKFSDGTLICYNNDVRFDVNITNSYEGISYYNLPNFNFPQQFVYPPAVNINFRGLAGGGYSFYNVTLDYFSGFVWKVQSKANATFWAYWIAIGRWK